MLPQDPAPAFGLTQPVTVSGVDEIPDAVGIDPEVVSFLSNRSRSTVRVWANPETGLSAAVGLTEYPYNVFAAAALAASIDDPEAEARAFDGHRGHPRRPHVPGDRGQGRSGRGRAAPRAAQRHRARRGR